MHIYTKLVDMSGEEINTSLFDPDVTIPVKWGSMEMVPNGSDGETHIVINLIYEHNKPVS